MQLTAKITRLNDDADSKIKAYATVNFDSDFRLTGVRVIAGQKGLFASMPGYSYTDDAGKTCYADYFYPCSKDAYQQLNSAIIAAYEHELAQTQAQPAYNDVEVIDDFEQSM
ncbi:MAG: SpoVG family protein [Clostridiales bacterium]|nr:SpoVG family protein [Clostridiales bacterium]